MKFFSQLIKEANDSYMLGDHSARSGEKPRGYGTQSAYANIGFYKRDPIDDVKKLPSEPLPEAVNNTIQIIVKSFLKIQEENKSFDILNLMIPYIQDFERFRSTIIEHSKTLDALERMNKRKEKLSSDLEDDPDDEGTRKELSELNINIQNSEEKEVVLDKTITELSNKLDDERPNLTEDIITEIINIVKDKINVFINNEEKICTTDNIKDAFHRYVSLVYGRREQVRGGLNRSYLLLDPIVSFVRFYNNAMIIYRNRIERENDKVKMHASSGIKGRNVFKSDSSLAMLNFLVDCINRITAIRYKKNKKPELKQYEEYITKSYKTFQDKLQPETKIKLGVMLSRFLANAPQSEGELKRFLLIDVQKELKIIK